jgi:hypothetical protein
MYLAFTQLETERSLWWVFSRPCSSGVRWVQWYDFCLWSDRNWKNVYNAGFVFCDVCWIFAFTSFQKSTLNHLMNCANVRWLSPGIWWGLLHRWQSLFELRFWTGHLIPEKFFLASCCEFQPIWWNFLRTDDTALYWTVMIYKTLIADFL